MALLSKVQFMQTGEKGSIKIDLQKVVEVFPILAGERIGRPVAAGEGIHECVERASDHHEKRIPDRIFLAAAKCGVLKDMCNAGGVHRYGSECDQKHVFRIVTVEVIVHRAGCPVFIFLHGEIQRGNRFASMASEGGMAINRGLRGARWIWGVDGFAHIYAGSLVLLRQGNRNAHYKRVDF